MEEQKAVTSEPRSKRGAIVLAAALVVLGGVGVWSALSLSPDKIQSEVNTNIEAKPLSTNGQRTMDNGQPPPVAHRILPAEVRGIYVTASTASSFDRYAALVDSVKIKGINTIVLDLKTENGSLAFAPVSAELKNTAPVNILMKDLDKIIIATHDAGMYLIARIPVFEDPAYAIKNPAIALHTSSGGLWKDAKGLAWLDPTAVQAWKYNVNIAREAHTRGFDEIQFDYIRFATDGAIKGIVFPVYDADKEDKRTALSRFFAYLDKELREKGIPISVDLFGFTAWHQNDLGIGQWYDDAIRTFDFVSPMVYPSHYPAGTLGFKNPAAYPYEIVFDSMKKGNEVIDAARAADQSLKLATQRPWLQAFDMGAVYTSSMMLEQVRAARETNGSGFLFWNASNRYASLPDLTK